MVRPHSRSRSWLTSFSFLVFTRLGVGVGEAVCAPVGTSWIGDLFPANRRARVLSLFMLGVPIGGALSFLLCGPIAQAWGWRTALVSAAAPAIILVPLLLLVQEPTRGASEVTSEQASRIELKGEVKGSVHAVLRIRTLWWIILSGALLNFNMYALATFLPAFMTRVHGYSVARAGVTCGIVYLIGGVCGYLLGGHLGDLVASNARNARLWMAAMIALLGAPIMYYGVTRPAGFAAATLVAIAIGYGAFNTYYGPVYASIQDIVPPNQRALTMSVYFMAMYLCGASFGPLLTGHLSDFMARRAMHAAGAVSLAGFPRSRPPEGHVVIMPILSVALAINALFRFAHNEPGRRATGREDAGFSGRRKHHHASLNRRACFWNVTTHIVHRGDIHVAHPHPFTAVAILLRQLALVRDLLLGLIELRV